MTSRTGSLNTGILTIRPSGNPRRGAFGRRLGLAGGASLGVLIVILLATTAAPLLAPTPSNQPDLLAALQGPSIQHWLGTDALGRDLLSRIIYGARPTVLGATLVIALSTVLGTAIALTMAWLGGAIDSIVLRVLDVLFSIPSIVLALTAVAILGPGMPAVVIGLTIANTPYVARIVRSAAIRERQLPYVSALWVQGKSGFTIATRHLLPNLAPIIAAQSVSALGFAVIDLASLSFLGLGVQPPTADWGLMVQDGLAGALRGSPTEALVASIAIMIFVGAVTVLGDRLTQENPYGN